MKTLVSSRALASATFVGLGMALMVTPSTAQAQTATATPAPQQSEIDALRQQMAEMQKRLDALEASQKQTATTPTPTTPPPPSTAGGPSKLPGGTTAAILPPAKPVPVTSRTPLNVTALIQGQSLDYLDEKVKAGGAKSSDTFRLRRAEVRLTAPTLTERLAATIMFDLARADSTNTVGTFQGGANNILQDLQLTYKVSPVANTKSQLFFDAGQFKTPLGYESALVSTGNVPFLERSLIFSGRDRFGTTYGDQRDTGIQLRAVTPQVEARVGVFNGFGDRQNSLAASDAKAIIALLAYKPSKVAGLTLGVSGGVGNTGVSFTSTTTPPTTINLRAHRNLVNAFLNYKLKKLTLQSEYLRGNASSFLAGTVTNDAVNPQGYYFGGSYLLSRHVELLGRYDVLDFDHKIDNATVRDYILGLNYYLRNAQDQNRIQINLVRRVGGEAAPTSATNPAANYRNDRLELRTGVQLVF